MADHLKNVQRGWKWLAVCCLAGAAAGYGLARIVPPRFQATAKIRIAVGDPPEPASLASLPSIVQPLAQAGFSRPQLRSVIDRFSIYGRGPITDEQVLEMQRHLQLEPLDSGIVALSFTAADEKTARDVCAELAARLIAEGNRPPVVDLPHSTREFLQEQLKDAKKKVDDQQARVADFKRRHAGIDGDGSSEPQRKLAELNRQLQATEASLAAAQERRASLTDALFTAQTRPAPQKPTESSPATEALEKELADKQAQLVTLQARYTPDHPDVVKLKTDIGNLQKKIADAKPVAAPPAAPETLTANAGQAPNQAQVQSQMRDLDAQISEKTRDRARLEQEIEAAQGQLAANPMLEIEYSDLKSAEAAAQTAYDALTSKLDQARKAEDLEATQRAALRAFTLGAPPDAARTFPDFRIFTLGGAFGGLLLGAFLASWSASRDKTLRTEDDVERLLGLPTFAVIPFVETPGDGKSSSGPWGDLKNQEERMAS